MKRLFIIIALVPILPSCTIHDPTYYTIYTPVIRLTNSSPALPPAVTVNPPKQQQTNKVSSLNFPEASDRQTATNVEDWSL